jgi:FAD-dependent urate hydroxylase
MSQVIDEGDRAGEDPHLSLRPRPTAEADLARLALQARRDLAALAHPAAAWVRPISHASGQHVFDVVIVGTGQSGLAIGLALKREGVNNVLLLDRSPVGYEGPWETFARMAVLRTPKALVGAELGIPSLSVRAWFEARYGAEAWELITWIPRHDWMRYLRWYRGIADLDIRNDTSVVGIKPAAPALALRTVGPAGGDSLLARRIVLATGQDGGGAWTVPAIVARALPPDAYAHSNGPIAFGRFVGKRIGILGHGGSAFDAALTALREGAARIDICFRRPLLPVVNPHRWLAFSAIFAHYPELPDRIRWNIARHFDLHDQPPPPHTFEHARRQPRLHAHADSGWEKVDWTGDAITVTTKRDRFSFDFVICATGLSFDLALRPELDGIVDDIALWSDRFVRNSMRRIPNSASCPTLAKATNSSKSCLARHSGSREFMPSTFRQWPAWGRYPRGSAAIATPSPALFAALPRASSSSRPTRCCPICAALLNPSWIRPRPLCSAPSLRALEESGRWNASFTACRCAIRATSRQLWV